MRNISKEDVYMIKYPSLKDYYTIGITAPSSGVEAELHNLVSSV